jgi:hypothetical protein
MIGRGNKDIQYTLSRKALHEIMEFFLQIGVENKQID